MTRSIPTTLGLLSLSFIGSGCGGDAAKVANTLEKICKAQCDCPETLEQWNDVSNCKKACDGYATQYEAFLADQDRDPACAELGSLLKELRDCRIGVCGYDYTMGCDDTLYDRLDECWPYNYDYNPYDYGGGTAHEREQLREMLLHPIPVVAINEQTLHQAK